MLFFYGLLSGSLGPVVPYLANARHIPQTSYSFLFIARSIGAPSASSSLNSLQKMKIPRMEHRVIVAWVIADFLFSLSSTTSAQLSGNPCVSSPSGQSLHNGVSQPLPHRNGRQQGLFVAHTACSMLSVGGGALFASDHSEASDRSLPFACRIVPYLWLALLVVLSRQSRPRRKKHSRKGIKRKAMKIGWLRSYQSGGVTLSGAVADLGHQIDGERMIPCFCSFGSRAKQDPGNHIRHCILGTLFRFVNASLTEIKGRTKLNFLITAILASSALVTLLGMGGL
jgi:hypothetical protein